MPTVLVEDFTDALALMATGTYDIQPGTVPVHDGSGGYVPGVAASVSGVLCSVQPLNGDEDVKDTDGERLDAWREVFAAYSLQPADERTGRTADVLLVDDVTNGPGAVPFEVRKVWPWGQAAHVTRALCRRQVR